MLFIASISAVCPAFMLRGDLEHARLGAELDDGLGHRDRALVVADHELEEEAVRLLPGRGLEGGDLGIRSPCPSPARASSSVIGSPAVPPWSWPASDSVIHAIIGPPDCGRPHCTSQSNISPR